MRNSVYFRIFIATALVVLVSFALFAGLTIAISDSRVMSEKRAMMNATAQETATYITTQHIHYGVALDDLCFLCLWLRMISGATDFDLVVTDAQGVVVACSDSDLINIGERIPDEVLQNVSASDTALLTMSTLGGIYAVDRQISAVPLVDSTHGEAQPFGFLFVTSDIAAFRQKGQFFSNTFLLMTACIMLLAFVISFIATKKVTKPLNNIVGATRLFARGEFGIRVQNRGREDEIGQLTEAFNAMADSLEQSEKTRRDFIDNLSHELKTPLTIVAGFADGLLDGTIPREDEERYLNVISSEAKRLSRLVRRMLELSTIRRVDPEALLESSFDITEVVRLALVSLEKKIDERQLDVEAKLPEDAIMTRGESDSITQVVYNLIDNAIKFSEHGGVIKLELWKRSSRVYVSLENRGETIPEDELPYIFERFHKADKSRSADREGAGLGLYIVKAILDNHNEDISVTSENGITKFVFSLTAV